MSRRENRPLWVVVMAQLIKCLPSKHTDLNSDSQKSHKPRVVAVHACGPSSREAETDQ